MCCARSLAALYDFWSCYPQSTQSATHLIHTVKPTGLTGCQTGYMLHHLVELHYRDASCPASWYERLNLHIMWSLTAASLLYCAVRSIHSCSGQPPQTHAVDSHRRMTYAIARTNLCVSACTCPGCIQAPRGSPPDVSSQLLHICDVMDACEGLSSEAVTEGARKLMQNDAPGEYPGCCQQPRTAVISVLSSVNASYISVKPWLTNTHFFISRVQFPHMKVPHRLKHTTSVSPCGQVFLPGASTLQEAMLGLGDVSKHCRLLTDVITGQYPTAGVLPDRNVRDTLPVLPPLLPVSLR